MRIQSEILFMRSIAERHRKQATKYGNFHVTEQVAKQKKLAKLAEEAADALQRYSDELTK